MASSIPVRYGARDDLTGARCVEDPEARLAERARAAGPLRRVLAALAGRLVERKAFERLGYARASDYARERLGMASRSLQELARVDAKLRDLPRLEAALVAGQLPWSKVRLLARFVTPESEAHFVALAETRSVRRLERELRAVDRGALEAGGFGAAASEDDEEPTEVLALSVPIGLAFKWQRTCRDAEKVACETTPPGRVLEWVCAEAAAGLTLPAADADEDGAAEPAAPYEPEGEEEDDGDREDEDGDGAVHAGSTRGPATLPRFLLPLIEGLLEADAHEFDARLRRAVRLEQRLEAEIAPLFRQVTADEYAWRGRYRTLEAYARDRLGLSPRKARALLRLERLGDRCPELRSAYRDGALSWVQAQSLARLVVGGEDDNAHLERWIAWASTVTVRRLDEAVGRALLWRASDPHHDLAERNPERFAGEAGSGAGSGEAGEEEDGSSERQTCARPTLRGATIRLRVTAPREVVQLARRVLCSVRLALERQTGRLPTEAEAFEALLDHALQSWQVEDRWLHTHSRPRREIFTRDGWRCVVPGCTSRRNLHIHHIVFRSAQGGDEPANLTTLCAFHHLLGVHGRRLRITGRAPDALWFELGTREGRPPLVRYSSGDRVAWTG